MKINPERYISPTVGMLTLKDILQELEKPGRDPRKPIEIFEFDKHVHTINDLREGMELPGIVNNITNFGAFVDIGVKQDGLVHISKMKKGFVKHPSDVVAVGDIVTVWVTELDLKKGRVGLSMIGPENK